MKTVTIYTDGACSGNPGPGGWGAILQYGKAEKELSGSEPSTTNNRMELLGVITALETLKEPCSVDLYSDSKYVVDGITKGWAKGWRARGWVKSDKKPAKIRNSGVVCSICWINTRCGSIGSRVTRIIRITTAVTSLPSASIRSINKSNTFFTKCEEGVIFCAKRSLLRRYRVKPRRKHAAAGRCPLLRQAAPKGLRSPRLPVRSI